MSRLSSHLIAALGCALVACGGSTPAPADHVCLDLDAGTVHALAPPVGVVGVGLSYAEHLKETGQSTEGGPPLFDKAYSPTTEVVHIPDPVEHAAALDRTEDGLASAVVEAGLELRPLVDYEVELGLVLLSDYTPGTVADLGYFVANDLSERAHAILGEGQERRYAYWGDSKGHPGFLPTTPSVWRPRRPVADGIPCVTLQTTVNGEVVQSQSTRDLVYTTSQLLDSAAARAGGALPAGTWLLTGTPAGVALATPAWKISLANLVGLDRFQRLGIVLGRAEAFLAPGDRVEVSGEGLGSVAVTLR